MYRRVCVLVLFAALSYANDVLDDYYEPELIATCRTISNVGDGAIEEIRRSRSRESVCFFACLDSRDSKKPAASRLWSKTGKMNIQNQIASAMREIYPLGKTPSTSKKGLAEKAARFELVTAALKECSNTGGEDFCTKVVDTVECVWKKISELKTPQNINSIDH